MVPVEVAQEAVVPGDVDISPEGALLAPAQAAREAVVV